MAGTSGFKAKSTRNHSRCDLLAAFDFTDVDKISTGRTDMKVWRYFEHHTCIEREPVDDLNIGVLNNQISSANADRNAVADDWESEAKTNIVSEGVGYVFVAEEVAIAYTGCNRAICLAVND